MIDPKPESERARVTYFDLRRKPPHRISSLEAASAIGYGQDMGVVREQEEVTRTRLVPAIAAILERLRAFREEVDRECAEHRRKVGVEGARATSGLSLAAYPIGFCHIIRDAVWDRAMADPEFVRLLGPGVRVRRVFILLKGQYFQNAVQLGNLYVDVANDTVWVHKPKLEWAPVEQVNYRNAETWDYFADVTQRYLNVALFPNRLFAFAFPVSPFFAIRASGQIELLLAQDILFLKDLGEGMPRLLALLANDQWMGRALPAPYEELLRKNFGPGESPSFPLKFAPATNQSLRAGVVAEFVELGRLPPDRGVASLERYMRIMLAAAKNLKQRALAPAPTEIARLRAEGLIPTSVQVHQQQGSAADAA